MSPTTRYTKKHAKASHRRRLKAQERLDRDRSQAQRAAAALHQTLEALGLPAGVMSPQRVRRRRAGGSGRGPSMIRSCINMVSSSA